MSEDKPSLRETINRIREKGIEWPTPDEIMEGRERASTEHAALTARVAELEGVVKECCKSMEGLVMSLKMASALLGTETLKDAKGVEAETQAIVSRARALLEQKP